MERVFFGIRCFIALIGSMICLVSSQITNAQPVRQQSNSSKDRSATRFRKIQAQDRAQELLTAYPKDVVLADLEELEQILTKEWILMHANQVDFSAELQALKNRLTNQNRRKELILELQKLFAKSLDSSAFVSNLLDLFNDRHAAQLPFQIDLAEDRYVAFDVQQVDKQGKADLRQLFQTIPVIEGYPYVVEIDGIPIEKWIETAGLFWPKQPMDTYRWRSVFWLGGLQFFRERLELENSKTVRVTFAKENVNETTVVEFPSDKGTLRGNRASKPDSQILDDQIAYLNFDSDHRQLPTFITETFPQYRKTKGLILDLRGYSDGSPEMLLILAPFFLPPKQPTMLAGEIVSLEQSDPEQEFFPEKTSVGIAKNDVELMNEYDKKTDAQKVLSRSQSLEKNYVLLTNPLLRKSNFVPWNNPNNQGALDDLKEIWYTYDKPVVLLIDHHCSLTGELIAASLKVLPQVTLIGSPTGGNVTSIRHIELPQTKIQIAFSTRAFFDSNGVLINGRGVQPDLLVYPDPDYYFGRRDRVLQRAMDFIKEKTAN